MWVRDGRGGVGVRVRYEGRMNGLGVRDKRKLCLICGCACVRVCAGRERRGVYFCKARVLH